MERIMKLSRKEFLLGLGGATIGAPLGAFASHRLAAEPASESIVLPSSAPRPEPPPQAPRNLQRGGNLSYAQCGEDLIIQFIFRYLGLHQMTYLDIGAHDPTLINNTYLFYTLGYRGVLVEPNVALSGRLREVRPEDTTLVAGIGVTAAREADYYLMTESSWNTFSKEEAEHQVEATKGRVSIKEVVKVPLLDINDVMDEHFKGAPEFVSIDAEGLHLALLKAIDYQRFRPRAICVETLVSGTNLTIPEIPAFMEQQGYVERGRSFVNTIFVDSRIL